MAYYRYNPKKKNDITDEYLEVFEEFDFGFVDYGCNFFCPECRNMMKCEAFSEVHEEWDSFYM